MKLNKNELLTLLKKQALPLKSLLFYGDNEGWVLPEIEKCLQGLAVSSSQVKRISEDILLQKKVQLEDFFASSSLFGEKEFVIVTNATDKLVPLLKETLPFLRGGDVFIVQSADYLGPASRLRQLYEKENELGSVPCYALDARTLSNLVKNFFIQQQKIISDSLSYQIATMFLEDPSVLLRELEKLSCYMGGKKEVEAEDIAQVLTPLVSEDSSKLIQAILRKDLKAIQVEYETDVGGNTVGLIRELLNKLLRLHEAKIWLAQSPAEEALRKVSPPVFFTEKMQFIEQTKRWQLQELEKTILKLLALETECKLNSLLAEDLFKNFLFKDIH